MRWMIFLNLPNLVALGPGVYWASKRNEYHKQKNNFSGVKVQPVRKADNLAAIYEPIV
jgi:hypothetical protein